MFGPNTSALRKEAGVALIFTALIIFAASVAVLFSLLDANDIKNERNKSSANALVRAKEALLSRAVTDGSIPGSLPCPSSTDDGTADMFSGTSCPTYMGHLPWKTLDINDLRDGYAEKLWYVLSPSFRDNPVIEPLNYDVAGTLTVDGRNDIVAIVFAPGPPVSLQARPSDEVSDYLEGENSDGDDIYTADTSSALNDQLIAITRDELMRAVVRRVAGEIKTELLAYEAANGRFPDASALGSPLGVNNYVSVTGGDSGTVPTDRTDTATCNYSGTTLASCSVAFSLVGTASLQRTAGTYKQWDFRSGLCSIVTTSVSSDTCKCTGSGSCTTTLSSFSCTSSGTCTMTLYVGSTGKYIYTPSAYGAFTPVGTTGGCGMAGTNMECSSDGVFGIRGINPPSWLTNNSWQDYFYYHKRFAADLQVGTTNNVEALLVGTGRMLTNPASNPGATQSRPSVNMNDYLDSAENTDLDLVYDSPTSSSSTIYNDQMFIVAP